MRGLVRKILYEVRWPTLLFALGLAMIMGLLTTLLPKILGDVDKIFRMLPFVKPILTALLGVEPGDGFTGQMMQAFLWVHPTVLALIWAFELMYCTRVPAGEIDRGTIDFLLGLPVSRWKLYLAETLVWILAGIFVLLIGLVGHSVAAARLQADIRPSWDITGAVICNLFAVYLAVGAFAFLISAASHRRGHAIGFVFSVLLFSFLLNFLAQFWEPAKQVAFLSIMHYYRPGQVISSRVFPVLDITILLSVALTCWLAGSILFSRRSICTV